MIQALRRRFILIAMLALTVTLTMLVGVVDFTYYIRNARTADWLLDTLYENGGAIPYRQQLKESATLTEESPYETRYFIITVAPDGTVTEADLDHIAAFDRAGASSYIGRILEQGEDSGYFERYRYMVRDKEDGGKTVYVLDCHQQQQALSSVLRITLCAAGACWLAVFLLLLLFSRQAVKPFAENLAKQRHFITDASHELKTPLAIIAANAEVLALESDNRWLESIRNQTGRMNHLVESLVELARTEETSDALLMQDFDLSAAVAEVLASFLTIAEAQDKILLSAVDPNVHIRGSEDAVRRLASLLLENAVKYTPTGGKIRVAISRQGKNAILRVTNTSDPLDQEKLSHLFDRFYRADPSRSRQTGGCGIGLSVAQAIIRQHKGRLTVAQGKNEISFTALFP